MLSNIKAIREKYLQLEQLDEVLKGMRNSPNKMKILQPKILAKWIEISAKKHLELLDTPDINSVVPIIPNIINKSIVQHQLLYKWLEILAKEHPELRDIISVVPIISDKSIVQHELLDEQMEILAKEHPELHNIVSVAPIAITEVKKKMDAVLKDLEALLSNQVDEINEEVKNALIEANCIDSSGDSLYKFKIKELETYSSYNNVIYLNYTLSNENASDGKLSNEMFAQMQVNTMIKGEAMSRFYTISMANPNKYAGTTKEMMTELNLFSKAASIESITPSSEMEVESAEQVTAQASRTITG